MTEEQHQRLIELESIDRVTWHHVATYEIILEREHLRNLKEEEMIAQQKMEFVRKRFMIGADGNERYYLISGEGATNKDEACNIILEVFEEFAAQFYGEEDDY